MNVYWQVSRLIPDAQGTKCNEEMEPILNTMHSHILRVPFRTSKGIISQWVSRFDIYPYLERFAQASLKCYRALETTRKVSIFTTFSG